MFVRLQRGGIAYDLAGGDGQRSETSNFRISTEGTFQRVEYIEQDAFDQFFRGGSSTSISFDSVLTFSTLEEAESYLLGMPQGMVNQAGQTATIGRLTADGTKQVETLTVATGATGNGNIDYTFTAADVSTITGSVPVTSGQNESQIAFAIAAYLRANADFAFRYTVTSTIAIPSGPADVIITKRFPDTNDGTLALTIANGTPSPGITGATSANTTAGVAPTISNSKTLTSVSCIINLAQQGVSIAQNVTLIGKY
jgi:hypothetical protein